MTEASAVPVDLVNGVSELMQITIPHFIKWRWSRSCRTDVKQIDSCLHDGTKVLVGVWDEVPVERRELIVNMFTECVRFKFSHVFSMLTFSLRIAAMHIQMKKEGVIKSMFQARATTVQNVTQIKQKSLDYMDLCKVFSFMFEIDSLLSAHKNTLGQLGDSQRKKNTEGRPLTS